MSRQNEDPSTQKSYRKLIFRAIWMQISLQDQASDAMLMQRVITQRSPAVGSPSGHSDPLFCTTKSGSSCVLTLPYLAISIWNKNAAGQKWCDTVYGCKILHQLMVSSKHPFSLSHKNYSVECHIYTIM